jgi:hypothetical protein
VERRNPHSVAKATIRLLRDRELLRRIERLFSFGEVVLEHQRIYERVWRRLS